MLQCFGYGHISVFTQVTLYLFMHKNYGLFMLFGKGRALLFKLLVKFFPGRLLVNSVNRLLKAIAVISKGFF